MWLEVPNIYDRKHAWFFPTDFNNVLSNLMTLTNANVHALQVHHETYVSQIKDALNVNGGDIENATGADYVLHFLTFGWKVIEILVFV